MRHLGLAVCLLFACAPPRSTTRSPAQQPAVSPATSAVASPPSSSQATAKPEPAPADETPRPSFEPIRFDDDALRRIAKVQAHVKTAAAKHELDPNLLNAIIWNESKFNPRARNRSGAKGLMQLMPKTSRAMARRLHRANRPYDPEFAVAAGALLLSILLEKFDGDQQLALFGYARGSGRVRAWQKTNDPMPEGVQKFIARVRRAQASFAALGVAN